MALGRTPPVVLPAVVSAAASVWAALLDLVALASSDWLDQIVVREEMDKTVAALAYRVIQLAAAAAADT
jgi:hypothetical protein